MTGRNKTGLGSKGNSAIKMLDSLKADSPRHFTV
jgi:hypothetical protein